MIRINLLKSPSRKSARPLTIPRWFIVLVVVMGALGAVGSAGYWFFTHLHVEAPVHEKIVEEGIVKPSTYRNAKMVEDVVRDIHDEKLKAYESGMLSLPFAQLSFGEKVNYEFLFAKRVCELLTKTAPVGIGLERLEASDFQTLYIVGLGQSREAINAFMSALIKQGITIMPKPYTTITPNRVEGTYKFVLSCSVEFGLQISDPLVDLSLETLPLRADLVKTVNQFTELAEKSSIIIKGDLIQQSAEKIGGNRFFIYSMSANGSYREFVKFISNLYAARLHCSFKKFKLTAKSRSNLDISTEIVIITRD